ncbi:hypothetical protein J5N97_017493 [Dioscorea zingiberensis]|uniref:Protein SCAR n=1 Tax=Dioscorea zingiberensis TaxID=325984 RepID=A0A9D5HGL0_9LILI|nr:hypothetical protein J5N97_017493 [Dioscorea zingiberensis]
MPTIRYQVRNEYGLASQELYHAADRDDPEAILEGVAMAGLVGVLRQLGDLAEFAAEIFHDLHEEVMATAARGHGMILRVQQLEAEFPCIEKALLSETSQISFAENSGINWHANLQWNQNLIAGGDMPRFILDSYEECRGPPRLFTLDKFDIAGAGACLKRYSDPSFFKTNLASSDKMEAELQMEKRSRKIKKKGSRWRNGATLESLLAPQNSSNLQVVNSEEVSETIPMRRVKLKHGNLNDSTARSGKGFMKNLIEVNLPEEKVFKNSKHNNYVLKKSFDTSGSVPEVDEVFIDNSVNNSSFKGITPTQSPIKQKVMVLPANKLEDQSTNDEDLFEALSEQICEVLGEKEAFTEVEDKLFNNANGSHTCKLEKSLLSVQALDQNELLTDGEYRENGHPDGYMSDDVTSEIESYVDALNTMESELETDSECKARTVPGQTNVEHQLVNSNEEVLKLQSHSPEHDSTQKSRVSLTDFINRTVPSISDLDTIDNLSDTHLPQGFMLDSDVPAISVVYPDEIQEASTEEVSRNAEDMAQGISENMVYDKIYDGLVSNITNLRSEITEASANSYVTDLTSTHHLVPQESVNEEARSVSSDQIKLPSDYAKDTSEVPGHLHGNVPNTAESLELPSQLTYEIESGELPEKSEVSLDASLDENGIVDSTCGGRDTPKIVDHMTFAEEKTIEVTTATFGIADNPSQQHGNIIHEVPASWLAKPLIPSIFQTEEPEKLMELEEARTLVDVSPTVTPNQDHSSIDVQPEHSLAEMENVEPAEDLACLQVIFDPQNADDYVESRLQPSNVLPVELDHLSYVDEPQCSQNMNSELKCLFPNEWTPQHLSSDYEKKDVSAGSADLKLPFECDELIVEADSDKYDPLSSFPEESKFHAESQEDYVPEEAVPNLQKVRIKLSVPKDLPALDSENSINDAPCSDVEDEQLSASTVSNSELPVEDSFTTIGEPADAVCHSLLSTDAQTDLNSNDEVDKIHSLRNVDFAVIQCSNDFTKEELSYLINFLSEPAMPVEASKLHDSNKAKVIDSPEGDERFHPFGIQLESEPLVEQSYVKSSDAEQELDSHAAASKDKNCKLGSPISNIAIFNQVDAEDSASFACSPEVSPTCLTFDISAVSLPVSQSFGLVPSETSPQCVVPFLTSFTSEVIENTPPLPPLPPLQWRMGKPQLGSQKPDGKTERPFTEQNAFSDLCAEGKKHLNCSGVAKVEMFQPENSFASLATIASDKIQHGSMTSQSKIVHALRLADLPPIVDEAGHRDVGHDGFREGVPKPSDVIPLLPAADDGLRQHSPFLQAERSQASELSGLVPTLDDERSRLDQVLPRVDTESACQSTVTKERNGIQLPDVFLAMPDDCQSSITKERNGIQSPDVFLATSDDDHMCHFSHGVDESENMQLMNLPMPQQCEDPKACQHDFLYLHGNMYPPYEITFPAVEDEKPNGKVSSIRARPRDPLIEAVASHDKSMLRKVSEMVQPSTKPKDERNSLLEQIKNKSFNLKPAVVTKPSIKGPSTNIKVAAILEKANAIRQAFVGSDDDDDGDSWSDS